MAPISEAVGWVNIAYISGAASLGWFVDYRLFVAATSWVHYLKYIHQYYFRAAKGDLEDLGCGLVVIDGCNALGKPSTPEHGVLGQHRSGGDSIGWDDRRQRAVTLLTCFLLPARCVPPAVAAAMSSSAKPASRSAPRSACSSAPASRSIRAEISPVCAPPSAG